MCASNKTFWGVLERKAKKEKKRPHHCGLRFVNLLEFICLISLSVATWCIWSMKSGWPSMTCRISANNVFLVLSKIHNKDMWPSDLRLPKSFAGLPADVVYANKGLNLFLLVKLSTGKGTVYGCSQIQSYAGDGNAGCQICDQILAPGRRNLTFFRYHKLKK